MLGSPLLPIFGCLGPAVGLIGLVLLMMGISNRQKNLKTWGIVILVVAILGVGTTLILSATNRG
jgi:hypothetical protein